MKPPSTEIAISVAPPDDQDWSASVLVVDDEALITRVLTRMLVNCDVTVVHDGQAALSTIAKDGDTFDIILCDMSMPGMTGDELYAQVEETTPDLCRLFVFMTGGTFGSRGSKFLSTVGRPAIMKPFQREDVLKVIRNMVEPCDDAGPASQEL